MKEITLPFLRTCFNEVDPVGIFFGINIEEYDPEIKVLMTSGINFSNLTAVKKELTDILKKYFEDVVISEKDIDILANKILQKNV